MANPTFFGEGSTPRRTDTRWRVLEKILGATIDGGGGVGGGWIPASGATDPPVDGSVNSYAYRNTVTGDTFINFGTIAVPQWYAV